MKLQRQIESLISQQASEWIEVLKTGGIQERTAFVAWLKESRRHVSEFLAMVAVDRELNGIDAQRRHDLAELVGRISSHGERVQSIRGARVESTHSSTRWLRRTAIAAAVVLTLLTGAMLQGRLFKGQSFTTATGEQRVVQLTDGSVVHLNTQSEIQVRIDGRRRDIRLKRGEALFKVAHDAQRPFWVRTQNAAVQALGTEFNVHAHSYGTTVSVLEGKVRVSSEGPSAGDLAPSTASAGQEVQVDDHGQLKQLPFKGAQQVIAWRERRLMFRDDTLEDMAAEFNRYNRKQFRLEGEAIRRRHYSGTFDADDPDSLAALLSRETDLEVEERGEDYVIRRNDSH